MSDIEDSLRLALRRKPMPAGLTERILAAEARPQAWKTWAMAAAMLLALGLGFLYQRHSKAVESERELLFALRLTSAKLQTVSGRLERPEIKIEVRN